MHSNAAIILVMFAVFSPVAKKMSTSLVMPLLIAHLVWAALGMHSVYFLFSLLLPLISLTATQFGFDLGRLTESETLLGRLTESETLLGRLTESETLLGRLTESETLLGRLTESETLLRNWIKQTFCHSFHHKDE